MDALRGLQLATEIAYLLLGVAAVRAAVRAPERARTDVALLFGALAALVVIQELLPLLCRTPTGCLPLPVPYALLRLVDNVDDLPPWQMWLALVLFIALSAITFLSAVDRPGWFLV